jgi:predicted acylesterase/phospholipase RssA
LSRCSRAAALVLALLAGSAGCAHWRENDPLPLQAPEHRFPAEASGANTNSLFLCLTFSGGGTRAAALSYGVLEKLRDTKIEWKGQTKRLLDEVDCISSVSGGSFTAAYYGLFKDRIFTDFRARFLDENVERRLFWRLFNPYNWVRLASPWFSRIDLAAEYYDAHVFERETFAKLATAGRPFVILNATNLANGERFEFTQDQFDFLASDLGPYPVARGVAASSAFPFLLSPISLKNYPHAADYQLPPDVAGGLEGYDVNRRRYYWARNRAMYVDTGKRPYVHLMDGGLADNIGLRPVESAFRRTSGFIRALINRDEIERFAIIVVNARTESEDAISRKSRPPGLVFVAGATATVAMGNYSSESIEVMRELAGARKQVQDTIAACQRKLDQCGGEQLPTLASGALEPFVIDIGFEALPTEERRRHFLDLPTSFELEPKQVQELIEVGPELLDASPEWSEFLEPLRAP